MQFYSEELLTRLRRLCAVAKQRHYTLVIACIVLFAPSGTVWAQGATNMTDMAPIWRFIEGSIERTPNSDLADAQFRRADAEADALGRPLYNPELEFELEDKEGSTRRPSTYNVGLSLTIDISGKRRTRKGIGRSLKAQAISQRQQENLEFAGRVISALAGLEAARTLDTYAAKQKVAAGEFLEVMQTRFRAGDIGDSEKSLAHLTWTDANATALRARRELEKRMAELTATCGCEIAEAPSLPVVPPQPPQLTDAELEGLADGIAAYQTSEAAAEAARGEWRLANRNQIPDPTFRIGYGEEEYEELVRVGVSVPLPVLNSGGAQTRAAREALTVAEKSQDLVRIETITALRSIYSDYAGTYEAWSAWHNSGTDAGTHQLELLQKLLKAGDLSITDYVVRFRESISVLSSGAELREEAWLAYAQWLSLGQVESFPLGSE